MRGNTASTSTPSQRSGDVTWEPKSGAVGKSGQTKKRAGAYAPALAIIAQYYPLFLATRLAATRRAWLGLLAGAGSLDTASALLASDPAAR